MSGQEVWTDNRGPRVVLNFDDRGICEVDRHAMHTLLRIAGFTLMTPAQTGREGVVAALAEHLPTGGATDVLTPRCSCGWLGFGWEEHIADVLMPLVGAGGSDA